MDLVQQDDKTSGKIVLGRITGVYGLKGWVKVFSYTDPMESIVDYSPWYIRPASGDSERQKKSPWTRVKLKAGKRHAKTVIAKLEHCNDCDEAQAYIGSEIAIEQDQLEALREENEFYWRDLIGLRVINQQNIELGVVTKLMETGANDVLVVTSEEETEAGSKECLIPWTMQQAIIAVDLEQGVIEVDWDLDY
ncbi:MAG: ribosome maturation factor RimM [Gammaproteobacteria bacterium]|nr:ribosome maturation factor RimM [Gammaproteobacteria bacterium]